MSALTTPFPPIDNRAYHSSVLRAMCEAARDRGASWGPVAEIDLSQACPVVSSLGELRARGRSRIEKSAALSVRGAA